MVMPQHQLAHLMQGIKRGMADARRACGGISPERTEFSA
jgi:hypothetical protein